MITPYKDVWMLAEQSVRVVRGPTRDSAGLHRIGVLWFRAPSADGARRVIESWLAQHDRISSGDYAALTGLTNAGARGVLDRFSDLLERGEGKGRNAHFRRRGAP